MPLLSAGACSYSYQVSKHEARTHNIKDISPDSGLVRLIQPYKDQLDVKMGEVIGRTGTALTKKQPECTLGNFMADAQLAAARKIDRGVIASVVNYGGIRTSYISEGEIQMRKMYELMPFDNMLTIIEVSGATLRELCDHMASLKGWPVSGMSYEIRDGKAINIKVGGQLLGEQAMYKLAVSDYIANGGDHCHFLKPYKQGLTNIFIRDALIAYVRDLSARNKALHPTLEKRVQNAE